LENSQLEKSRKNTLKALASRKAKVKKLEFKLHFNNGEPTIEFDWWDPMIDEFMERMGVPITDPSRNPFCG